MLSAKPAEAAPLPFHLPTPAGWRTETIPFPLSFAPDLGYRGLEELRFAPGMFTPKAPDFWTYGFAWWVEGTVTPDAAKLGRDLGLYFDGLAKAVEKPERFDAKKAKSNAKLKKSASGFEGTADAYDAFATHGRVTLNVRIRSVPCAAQGHTALLFEISPQPTKHIVWKQLEPVSTGFRCER